MHVNPDQTMIVQQQTQIHQERAQNLMSKALTQVKEKSRDVSLASIIAQIKAVLNNQIAWVRFLRDEIT